MAIHKTKVSRKLKPADPDAAAISIPEFCRRYGFSVPTFYKYADDMPVSFKIGTRRLISREAAAAWRKRREDATAAEAAKREATADQ